MIEQYSLPHIDTGAVSMEMTKFRASGISGEFRRRLLISLTSFPERICETHFAAYSLLRQSLKPDAVLLWLAKDEFPRGEKDLPDQLLRLCENGLTIKWYGRNIRSFKKIIPALCEYPNAHIVTADDDIYYPENWLERLWRAHEKNPSLIHSQRAHYISVGNDGSPKPYRLWDKEIVRYPSSYLNFGTSGAGTIYSPGLLHPDVLRDDLFMNLCPESDDIWLWAMSLLAGSRTNALGGMNRFVCINPGRELGFGGQTRLGARNVEQGGNDEQMKNVLAAYPALCGILRDEWKKSLGVRIYKQLRAIKHKFVK